MSTAPSPNDLTRQQLDELDALLQRMLALPLNPPEQEPAPVAHAPGSPGLTSPGSPEPPAILAPPLPEVPPAVARNWRIDPPAPVPVSAPHLLPEPVADDPPVSSTPPPAPLPVQPVAAPEPPLAPTLPPPEPEPELIVPPVGWVPEPEPELPRPIIELPNRAARPTPAPTPGAHAPGSPGRAPGSPGRAPGSPGRAPGSPGRAPGSPGRAPGSPGSAPPVGVMPILWPLVAFNWVFDVVCGLFGPPGRLLRSGPAKNLLGGAGLGLLAYTAAAVAQQHGWVALPFPLPWPR
jgi:hypothetical protein